LAWITIVVKLSQNGGAIVDPKQLSLKNDGAFQRSLHNCGIRQPP